MDGTHVAGIATADGEDITGVAPGAKLRAYKVLSNDGVGKASTIIAGIERAIEDSVDVTNMSLGGSGAPDEPRPATESRVPTDTPLGPQRSSFRIKIGRGERDSLKVRGLSAINTA